MVRARRLTIAVGAAIMVVLATPASVLACSCANRTAPQALRQADAAIVGRLIEVVPRGDLQADFRYRAQRVYKPGRGLRQGAVVAVRSNLSGAACGLPAGEDRRYGLFLTRSEGRWAGSSCAVVEPRSLSAAAEAAERRRRGTPGKTGCTS